MTVPCRRRPDCRLCGSRELVNALRLTPTPLANAFVTRAGLGAADPVYPLELALCAACGHLQLRDVVDAQALFGDYVYVSGTSPAFVRHFERYAQDLAAHAPVRPGALVIDVGSNDGTLLGFFKARGCRVVGVDPARAIAERATAAGIETLPEFFGVELARRIAREHGRAALVMANNVFAHVDDLAGFVQAVRALLAPEGLFAFEVSYLADVYEHCLFDTIYHEHLDYHAVAPLVGFFTRQGMRLVRTERVATHGGSIRGLARAAGAGVAPDGSVEALVAHEKSLGLERAATYAAFAQRIDGVKRELGRVLAQMKAAGASVAGFGAPAKATTLMYHLEIGPEIVDFIVDDSPLKQGLYSPGLHVPIVAGAEIAARKPDVLLLLAWNFAGPIIAKHEAFLRAGGRFVVPLPEVRIVASS